MPYYFSWWLNSTLELSRELHLLANKDIKFPFMKICQGSEAAVKQHLEASRKNVNRMLWISYSV
jgi:hypothetical protein